MSTEEAIKLYVDRFYNGDKKKLSAMLYYNKLLELFWSLGETKENKENN